MSTVLEEPPSLPLPSRQPPTEAVAHRPRPPRRLLTGDLHSDILVYSLLNYFSLDERDAGQIEEEHGIGRERLERFVGVRSAPSSVHVLFALYGVMDYFGDVGNWPAPFYVEGPYLCLDPPRSGFILPVWRGHFRAWLHYKNAKDTAPRWVTSSHQPGGSKVRPSVHVVGPQYARASRVCVLVSDALTAEGVAQGGIVSVVGLNGVSPTMLTRQLRETWPELRGVVLDLDVPDRFLVRTLEASGLAVEVG